MSDLFLNYAAAQLRLRQPQNNIDTRWRAIEQALSNTSSRVTSRS